MSVVVDSFSKAWALLGAGLSGAIVALSLHNEKRSKFQALVFVVSGMLTALYLAPWIASLAGLEDPDSRMALSFAIGCGWQSVASRVIDFINNYTPALKKGD